MSERELPRGTRAIPDLKVHTVPEGDRSSFVGIGRDETDGALGVSVWCGTRRLFAFWIPAEDESKFLNALTWEHDFYVS